MIRRSGAFRALKRAIERDGAFFFRGLLRSRPLSSSRLQPVHELGRRRSAQHGSNHWKGVLEDWRELPLIEVMSHREDPCADAVPTA